MAAIPGNTYMVQAGDTLSTIAQQAYRTSVCWDDIYIANAQVIGEDPGILLPGTVLFLPLTLHNPKVSAGGVQLPNGVRAVAPPNGVNIQYCEVVAPEGIRIRTAPTTRANVVATFPVGATLNYYEIVDGESVNGNARWGHSIQNHYYWMGATDNP